MTYNVSGNISGIVQLWNRVNQITNQWFSMLFCFSMFIIILLIMMTRGYRFGDCIMVGGFITFWLGSLMFAAGLVAGWCIFLMFAFTLIGFVMHCFKI